VTRSGQTRRALGFFDGKIQDAMLAGDIKRAVHSDVDVILSNIDSKADSSSGRDAILRVFLKVFNEKLGYSGDHPHIADLERRLEGQGRLEAFKPYADELDFVSVYPFAPYQFQLVQKVFEAIRRHGVTGLHLARGERSMLDAFQSAAVQLAGEEIGVLAPLHRFYPAIESFLEGIVKSTIDNAERNDKLEDVDVLVLKTLFLIRYVDEIRGNVDNLVTLFVDRIDADRLALRNQIEASLQRLEKETLIGRNGDEFSFLTNEERDISREIKDVDLSSAEEAKFLGELIFEDVLKGLRKHRFPDKNKDFGINRLCDLHPHGMSADGDLVLSVVTPLAEEYTFYDDAKCTLQSAAEGGRLIMRLDDDKTLGRELRTWIQTDTYVARKNDGTASTTWASPWTQGRATSRPSTRCRATST